MQLDATEALFHPGQEYRFSGSQAIADQEICGDTVRIEDCFVEGIFMADHEGNVSVKGHISTAAYAPCANCLKEAKADVENEFDEVFIRGGDPEDDEVFSFQDKIINLEKLIMSYVVMTLPIRFLCSEDCPGMEFHDPDLSLNPDLNVQHPFAALGQLWKEDEEV